jgi:hypothetical protein
VHLPELRAASRGGTCHLAVPAETEALGRIAAALPLVREAVAVLHVPPGLFQDVLRLVDAESSAVLLCADLAHDRGLTALVVRELRERALPVRVLKQPLAWVAARRALFGVPSSDGHGGLPIRLRETLLQSQISAAHTCYADLNDPETDPARTAQQQRRGNEGAGSGRELHRDEQRQAGG